MRSRTSYAHNTVMATGYPERSVDHLRQSLSFSGREKASTVLSFRRHGLSLIDAPSKPKAYTHTSHIARDLIKNWGLEE